MYVVCLLFYAIGGVLVFIFNRSRLADMLFMVYVSERDDYYFVLFNSFSISSILGMVPSI
jgi:hypothetical protein